MKSAAKSRKETINLTPLPLTNLTKTITPVVMEIFHFYSFSFYRDLNQWDAAKEIAVENFKAQRNFMHSLTATMVAKDLNVAE